MADRERLTSNTTFYFDASAPDNSGDGSAASPYQTLQYFFDNVITNIDTDIYTLTCQLAPGTYAPVDISSGWAGQGQVQIVGDPSAPSDYVIEATAPGASAVRTHTGMFIPSFEVEGVELRSAGGNGILYGHAGYGYFGNIVFGDCANAMVMTDNHLQFITSSGPIAINGSAQYAQYADSGRIYWLHTTTFTADVEFQAFTRVGFFGFILGDHWNHDLNGHTVEGLRFLAEGGGIISANARGLDLFPGDEPGIVTRGGQYLSDDHGGSLPAASTDDVLRGDDLDNVYTYNGGMDFFDGRGGSDTLDLSDRGTGVLIDLVEGEVYSRDGSAFLLYVESVENFVGTPDDDIFRAGNGGHNVFIGGAGTDTAVFSGNRSNYSVNLAPDGEVEVIDNRPGQPDGVNVVADVERLVFADGTFAPVAPLDVVWRHDDGSVAVADRHFGVVPNTFQIRAAGDFDGDGDGDILWRHTDGLVVTWELENGQFVTDHNIAFASTGWEIQRLGDFDGDGDADIIWRHNDGAVVTWEMENNEYVVNHNIAFASTGWRIDGTGDFDGDGDSDIIWRHNDGAVVTWEMENGAYVQNHNIAFAATTWQISGTGDFDGDGDADILWRHNEGAVVFWEMQGGDFATSHSLPGVATTWQIRGTEDFDSDGDSDILWKHVDGQVVTWNMEDGTLFQTRSFGFPANVWQIAGTGEFDLV
jgi:hypothetical protein